MTFWGCTVYLVLLIVVVVGLDVLARFFFDDYE